MRVRLQLLLPFVVGLLMAAGFLIVASTVGDAVRGSLPTVPGITRERAVEAAGRAVVLAGIFVTVVAVAVAVILARMIVRPLAAVRRAAERLDVDAGELRMPAPATPVAEIRDTARGLSRATAEFRDRHQKAVREGTELNALVEAVSEGILHVGADGRIVRANRASRALLGLPDDAAGRPVGGLLRNTSLRDIARRAAGGATAGGEPVPSSTEVVLDDRRVLVSMSPQPGGGFVATLVDLTDLRRLEEVRRDFVANASHELKTPLTSIRGYSETLLADDLPESERRQFLTTIARNARRLQRIVDDLLDLSRLETGRWRPELVPLDPLRIARAAWETLADQAAGKRVSLTDHAEGHGRVLADRGGLDQIFSNLFDNALRYSRAGGQIRVSVRPAREDDAETPGDAAGPGSRKAGEVALADDAGNAAAESAWVLIEVSDTGAGIPRDALPRIFERFYRVDPARSRSEGGTGLGLSIVKHLMESMGGHVHAESTLGKGTTIRLWLPAAPAPTPSGYTDVTEP